MHEGDKVMAAQQLGCYKEKDPMSQMTCGENLERKIAEQTERLMMLEAAKKEMQDTGLYNVKISTLRDTMSW
jgi:hypothetical protein